MRTSIRTLEDGRAIVIPQPIWDRLELATDEVDIALERGAIVIRAAEQDHAAPLPMHSVPAPLAQDTPVWDDYNDIGDWNSLAALEQQQAGGHPV